MAERAQMLPEIISTNKKWYVIETKLNSELQVMSHLDAATNLAGYLPMKVSKNKREPIFKGYVFAKHDLEGFHLMKYKPGVKNYVSFGHYPTSIPKEQIELIISIEENFNQPKVIQSSLVKGQKVKILHGVLAGREGVLSIDASVNTVAIAIETLGQSVLVQLPLSDVILQND